MSLDRAYLENLRQVIAQQDLDSQRALLEDLTRRLNTDLLSCAAAIVYLQDQELASEVKDISPSGALPLPVSNTLLGVKMLRYRLEVGTNHQVTTDALKKLLIEESGVDPNNINNISIRADHTLIELPDEMPIDIFLHLKTVEINQQPLAIKRLKNRNKRRNGNRFRRKGPRNAGTSSQPAE